MFEKVLSWATITLVCLPWLIMILCCITGGEVSFSSKGMIPQLKQIFEIVRSK